MQSLLTTKQAYMMQLCECELEDRTENLRHATNEIMVLLSLYSAFMSDEDISVLKNTLNILQKLSIETAIAISDRHKIRLSTEDIQA